MIHSPVTPDSAVEFGSELCHRIAVPTESDDDEGRKMLPLIKIFVPSLLNSKLLFEVEAL